MRKLVSLAAFFTFSSLLFGQLDSNSVTVTASRTTILQPDQVLFAVRVTSGLNTSLDDVLAAVKSAGITVANFSGVATASLPVPGQPPQPMLQWLFSVTAPFSQIKATVSTLAGLQQNIAQANNGLAISFEVQGSQASLALQQSQACNLTELIADAAGQAQKLAGAAGLVSGPILAMSSLAATPVQNNNVVPAGFAGLIVSPLVPQAQNCVLTVKFALTRF